MEAALQLMPVNSSWRLTIDDTASTNPQLLTIKSHLLHDTSAVLHAEAHSVDVQCWMEPASESIITITEQSPLRAGIRLEQQEGSSLPPGKLKLGEHVAGVRAWGEGWQMVRLDAAKEARVKALLAERLRERWRPSALAFEAWHSAAIEESEEQGEDIGTDTVTGDELSAFHHHMQASLEHDTEDVESRWTETHHQHVLAEGSSDWRRAQRQKRELMFF